MQRRMSGRTVHAELLTRPGIDQRGRGKRGLLDAQVIPARIEPSAFALGLFEGDVGLSCFVL